jgi:uncharacterized protein YndB with AHSA1/START domain
MTGATVLEFPSELEVLITREFDAPIELLFDVLTNPEHVRHTFAPYGEEVTVCEIDRRVGGNYHYVMVTPDGVEMSFRGTFIELEPPNRVVSTWLYDGWPDAEAVETVELQETVGGTKLTYLLSFRDEASRARMTKYDGLQANFENIAEYIASLLAAKS